MKYFLDTKDIIHIQYYFFNATDNEAQTSLFHRRVYHIFELFSIVIGIYTINCIWKSYINVSILHSNCMSPLFYPFGSPFWR